MRLGYTRPLEATDLYKLQDERSSGVIAEKIVWSFEERQRKAQEYNVRLARGDISPGLKGIWWSIRGQREQREKEWREKTGLRKPSLAMAANDSVFWFFWSAGILRLFSDVASITSPLLVKVTSIPFSPTSAEAYAFVRPSSSLPKVRMLLTVLVRLLPRSHTVLATRSVSSSSRFCLP